MSTNCKIPPELDDQQLLAYLDNPDANQDTARHLEQCPHCRQKAGAFETFQKRLGARLYRSTCPSTMELGEYHFRMLSPNQTLIVAQHLRECPHCAKEISVLKGFLDESSVRPDSLKPIKNLFARLVSGTPGTGSIQAFPALRGQVKELPIFEAEGIMITMDIQASPNGQVSILGQVAADDQDRWTGATVELDQAYVTPLVTSLDDLGAFTFEALYPVSVQITVTSQHGIAVQTEKVFIAI